MGKGVFQRTRNQAHDASAITTSDTVDLPDGPAFVYIGVSGDVKVDTYGGTSGVVFKNAQQGTILPIKVKRVYATLTTATNLVAVYE